jgi:D-aspartate ligase
MTPTAVVINVFYTGLGIVRSLGERGIPVIGLSAQRGIYGNFTRYGKIRTAPDSRKDPAALLEYLVRLGKELGAGSVIFPTRDDDVIFLDRYREELSPWFHLVLPPREAVRICLDKWETFVAAGLARVATPRCWRIESADDLERAAGEVTFPCVLKPLVAQSWRQGRNWEIVGARKAIGIGAAHELFAEYAGIAKADPRVLLQEMVPGGDESLFITACYIDRGGNWAGAFNTQKLIQAPEGFGTGCIVQSVYRPELFEPTRRLLATIGFTGIAEVEYKWDARTGSFQLIEINPRPWDQHTLGKACGVDLMYAAYCDHAGLPPAAHTVHSTGHRWIAEDTFLTEAVRLAWRRDVRLGKMLRSSAGRRIYAIWSWKDPMPLAGYMLTQYLPGLAAACWQAFRWRVARGWRRHEAAAQRSTV